MKKSIGLILFIIVILWSFTQWDNYTTDMWIDPNVVHDINTINMDFCDTTQWSIDARPGQTKDICMKFNNRNTETVNIIFWFTDGYEKNGIQTCNADMSPENTFAKLIKIKSGDASILVPGSTYVTKIMKISIPKTASGIIHWCIGYYIDWSVKKNDWGIFNVVIRKAKNINVVVTWNIYNFWRRDDIKENKKTLLQWIIVLCSIYLLRTIFQSTKKKINNPKHKK